MKKYEIAKRKDFNKEVFQSLHKEIFPEEYPDEYGLIPNTWYTMTTGTKATAFYKGLANPAISKVITKRTIGLEYPHSSGLIGIVWFSDKKMKPTNVVRSNVLTNITPKLIRCAETARFKPGGKILYKGLVHILGLVETFKVNGDSLTCETECGKTITLLLNGQWNLAQVKPV